MSNQNLGEFESVETSPTVTHVSFRDRKTAEKFYFSLHGKELPGVKGKLELSWVNTPLPPVPVKKSASDGDAPEDNAMSGMEDAPDEAGNEQQQHQQAQQRTVNMDYEVGDDYGWEG